MKLKVGRYKVHTIRTTGEGTDVSLDPVQEFTRTFFIFKRKYQKHEEVFDGMRMRLPQGTTVKIGDVFDCVLTKVENDQTQRSFPTRNR